MSIVLRPRFVRHEQGPRSNFEIGWGEGGGTISDSILGGGGGDTFSY